MNSQVLPSRISEALEAGATLIVPSSQRQAALRAAWVARQRAAGKVLWNTPRIFIFTQYCEGLLADQWAAGNLPDRLLPAGAEWASLRELRREGGGNAEARALLTAIRALSDWRIPHSAAALGATPEALLLHDSLQALENASAQQGRKPLRGWLEALNPPAETLLAVGFGNLPAAHLETLRRLGAEFVQPEPVNTTVAIATADNDQHELDLIASWCRARLGQDPAQRLLIVDAKLRQRRRLYERRLSQTLSPSQWLAPEPRHASLTFVIEGGRPLNDFPIINHAVLSLRLLTARLRFDEAVRWLRLPFLDRDDLFAGVPIEALLRTSRKLEYSGEELAALLERANVGSTAAILAQRLRLALATLSGERRVPAEWAPRFLKALRQLGWHGARALRSDEQQTVARWHALLDEYSSLGAWLPRSTAADAVAALTDLAGERNFDAASVAAPVTLTESLDDPVVRYDGIWVAGLDAAQWPAPPRPDVFIPLRLQVNAGVQWASAAGQTRSAKNSLAAWRASADELVCSWARLEGDAHRSLSPLLAKLPEQGVYAPESCAPDLAETLHAPDLELLEDIAGVRVDVSVPVRGGVQTITLQSECGFHAYGELRLAARKLESPAPGVDARERGMLLHKALEFVWLKFERNFNLLDTEGLWRSTIADSVAAAVADVFRGFVPEPLKAAVDRETHRIEKLIEKLLEVERERASFVVEKVEARREVSIAGGQFELRIDRIDFIEGGGYAILDYKSGEPRPLRWQGERIRDPQLLAYLLAERGRNVQALANVNLSNRRAKFTGRSSRKGLLPGVNGMPGLNPNKVPPEQIEAAWQQELSGWLAGLHQLAASYLAGHAPVEPAADVCRHCHLTTLCRRVELAAAALTAVDDAHE